MAADSKYSCAEQHELWIAVILPAVPALVIICPFQSQVVILFFFSVVLVLRQCKVTNYFETQAIEYFAYKIKSLGERDPRKRIQNFWRTTCTKETCLNYFPQ